MRSVLIVPLLLVFSAPVAAADDEGAGKVQALRGEVLKGLYAAEGKPDAPATAYKKLFRHVGLAGLKGLAEDKDTSIALQVAWEIHKRPAKRPKPVGAPAEDTYDPAELTKFVQFLKERTRAPVPDWWAEEIVDVDVYPGKYHRFTVGGPDIRASKAGEFVFVPKGAELERADGVLRYTSGGRSVEFPEVTFGKLVIGDVVGWVGDKRSVVAAITPGGGYGYRLAGFGAKGGKPEWVAKVWAVGRKEFAKGRAHAAEVIEKDGTAFVFGVDLFGMYLEAFDVATGACRFRFCTCYWFDHSEGWDLK